MRRTLVTRAEPLAAGCRDGGATDPSGTATHSTGAARDCRPALPALSEQELTEALLAVPELPPGCSQDPPEPEGRQDLLRLAGLPGKIDVERAFTNGGGLSPEFRRVELRRYADADQAKAALKSLTDALATCTGETWNGSEITYAPMSAPGVGNGAVGSDDRQWRRPVFVLLRSMGLVIVKVGGAGLTADADEVINLLRLKSPSTGSCQSRSCRPTPRTVRRLIERAHDQHEHDDGADHRDPDAHRQRVGRRDQQRGPHGVGIGLGAAAATGRDRSGHRSSCPPRWRNRNPVGARPAPTARSAAGPFNRIATSRRPSWLAAPTKVWPASSV